MLFCRLLKQTTVFSNGSPSVIKHRNKLHFTEFKSSSNIQRTQKQSQ